MASSRKKFLSKSAIVLSSVALLIASFIVSGPSAVSAKVPVQNAPVTMSYWHGLVAFNTTQPYTIKYEIGRSGVFQTRYIADVSTVFNADADNWTAIGILDTAGRPYPLQFFHYDTNTDPSPEWTLGCDPNIASRGFCLDTSKVPAKVTGGTVTTFPVNVYNATNHAAYLEYYALTTTGTIRFTTPPPVGCGSGCISYSLTFSSSEFAGGTLIINAIEPIAGSSTFLRRTGSRIAVNPLSPIPPLRAYYWSKAGTMFVAPQNGLDQYSYQYETNWQGSFQAGTMSPSTGYNVAVDQMGITAIKFITENNKISPLTFPSAQADIFAGNEWTLGCDSSTAYRAFCIDTKKVPAKIEAGKKVTFPVIIHNANNYSSYAEYYAIPTAGSLTLTSAIPTGCGTGCLNYQMTVTSNKNATGTIIINAIYPTSYQPVNFLRRNGVRLDLTPAKTK